MEAADHRLEPGQGRGSAHPLSCSFLAQSPKENKKGWGRGKLVPGQPRAQAEGYKVGDGYTPTENLTDPADLA